MNGEFDVLVATTIIESGLDVPMPIRFSLIMLIILVCLTCIRCEVVDEATRRRFVILSPPYSVMTDDARKRIQALEQFSDLGAVLISP
jgi:transcription-repair coupling factor (superfamily II helicase)